MNTAIITYDGELRTKAVHTLSKEEIITDAPIDNQGKGEAFSPTDLLSSSLASCMLTIMGIKARDQQLDIKGSYIEMIKNMASDPRRVKNIRLKIFIKCTQELSDKQRITLERAARTCPVALSLHPELEQDISFTY